MISPVRYYRQATKSVQNFGARWAANTAADQAKVNAGIKRVDN